jgi:hypothetical protein
MDRLTAWTLGGGQRVRLGVTNGNQITDLTIPAHLVRGLARLQFLCDPIGGSRARR